MSKSSPQSEGCGGGGDLNKFISWWKAPVPNLNATHALTAALNAAKQSMKIWVLSNDI
ncbi:hypothetical protein [Xylella fastidiosa]|uniref:hypothetical protein n=1 Tax=Xylella fastidiosa TaxID=2371 RepID=UPI0034DF9E22